MIRLATGWDLPACVALLHACPDVYAGYRYEGMDGLTIVDEGPQATLRGLVRLDLGRPETHVRLIAVAPEHRGGGYIAKRLLGAVIQQAAAHGSQGLEGFVPEHAPDVLDMHKRLGSEVWPGWKVRWRLSSDSTPWFR